MIRQLGDRVRLLHLKDYKADGGMADVGAGTLDIPALLAAGAGAGVEHRFVEHDFPPEPYWPSVEASLGYLRGLG
jgi:sugar phosphate isomerase/epimerase